jgi:hypothetical protein
MTAQNLYVRFSTGADLGRIVDFYNNNKSPYVFPREAAVWKERAEAGAVTLIEDDHGRIVASSISYPIIVPDADGNPVHKWTEIGSTLIALDGAGLFRTLISAQVLRATLLEPPTDGFVLEIVVSNARSIEVFEKVGGKPFDVPPDLFAVVQETFTAESKKRDVRWFHLGADDTPALANNIIDTWQHPDITRRTDGQRFRVDFSRNALQTLFLDDVKKLAGKGAVSAKKPVFLRASHRHGI